MGSLKTRAIWSGFEIEGISPEIEVSRDATSLIEAMAKETFIRAHSSSQLVSSICAHTSSSVRRVRISATRRTRSLRRTALQVFHPSNAFQADSAARAAAAGLAECARNTSLSLAAEWTGNISTGKEQVVSPSIHKGTTGKSVLISTCATIVSFGEA